MKISKANEIKLIFVIAVALVVFISLLTFNRDDIKFLTSSPNISSNNIVGSVGAYLGWFFLFLIGYGAYAVPVFMLLGGITYLFKEKPEKAYLRIFGIIFSILAISAIFSLVGVGGTVYRFQRGGLIGLTFSDFLIKYLGTAGTFIVITVLFLLSVIITTDFLIFPIIAWILKFLKSTAKSLWRVPHDFLRSRLSSLKAIRKSKPHLERAAVKHDDREERMKEKIAKIREIKKAASPAGQPSEPIITKAGKEAILARETQEKEKAARIPQKKPAPASPYELPSLDLLTPPPPLEERQIKSSGEEENSRILEETLLDFGVEAKVVGVSKGPVITRYELQPARGVTVSKITSLSDNIALVMKSVNIRVVAPIPGKGTVGVEVPNLKGSIVYLKEILESKEYRESRSKLSLALGKDISGASIVADLNDMPHLLIAGATGSGKTVCVNSIITSLLFHCTPDDLRFLMVDPKRVELAIFNNLPHLLAPVVTDPKKVSHALNWAVNEMEERYEIFAELGVRNISAYNIKAKAESLATIPYIVVIIDELADLMLVAQQEVENTIARLAQLSRAVGIHMIIATQRPSVDVITGVIKANLPARISFKVASKVDSRTVIDMNGAEKLIGKGDMLFIEPGNPKPVRGQASLVNDDEIARIASFIREQRQPNFEEEILKVDDKPKFKQFEKDEIYEEAVKLVLQTKQASVSMLQRRLGIGYTRAARLIDMMEDDEIVGPYQGSKPREIITKDLIDDKT